MQIDISSSHVSLSAPLMEHVWTTLESLEMHSGERIRIIHVRLGDVNGPKGGLDKICRLQAQILNRPSLNTEGRSRELYTAFGLAARRMNRLLSSACDETRNRNPNSHQRVLLDSAGGFEHSLHP